MNNRRLVFLDTETTGIEEDDRLIQVAYKTNMGEEEAKYFKPIVPITLDAMSVHHVTNEHVRDCERFENSDTAKRLQDWFDEGAVMIAHNANFDKKMLERDGVRPKYVICTLKLIRHLDADGTLGKHNLQYLRYEYKLDLPDGMMPHEAMADVIVMEQLFNKVIKHRLTLKEMIDISSKPSLLPKMPFGKHSGKSFKDILANDYGYYLWAQKTFLGDEDKEDILYSFEYWDERRT